MSGESAVVECGCFTRARRHHQVLGRIGGTVLPFQVTAPSLVAFSVVAGLGVFGWRWWSWLLPTPFDVMAVLCAPVLVAVVAQTTRVEGRDPFRAGLAALRYLGRPRGGLVAGRRAPRHLRRAGREWS